jgi:hypothetical protein
MIEIVLNDKIIEVKPELNIGQFQRIFENMDNYKQDPTQLLSLYLNVPLYDLKDLPREQVEFVERHLTSLLTSPELKDETHFVFEHNGVKYGLENDWTKLAWGAWVDLEVYSSEKVENNIHKIMAILYRPIVGYKKDKYILEPYKSEEIEDRAEEFKELPFKYWAGCSSFFLLIVTVYMSNLQNSLDTALKLNKTIEKGWKIMPKWVKRKLPLDSILVSPLIFQKKTLRSFNKLKK